MSQRTYLITGTSGIAAATAEMLTERPGAQLFFVGLEEGPAAALSLDMQARGASVSYLAGDLTTPAFADSAAAACIERFGRIDALFNVAGGSGRAHGDGPLDTCSDSGWAWTLETNLTTHFRMSRAVIRHMLHQSRDAQGMRGVLLNMSSILALDPAPEHFNTIAYAASKGAVISMSRTIAAAYAAEGIGCNVVAPALVPTAMSRRASEQAAVRSFIQQKQPLSGGMIEVEQVGALCAFLLGESASRITGQVLPVDAGWSLR